MSSKIWEIKLTILEEWAGIANISMQKWEEEKCLVITLASLISVMKELDMDVKDMIFQAIDKEFIAAGGKVAELEEDKEETIGGIIDWLTKLFSKLKK